MDFEKLGPTKIIVLVLEKLAKGSREVGKHFETLFHKVRSLGTVQEQFLCPELWICLFFAAYCVFMLVVGIRYKRTVLSVFVFAFLFTLTSYFEKGVSEAARKLLEMLFREKDKPQAVKDIMENPQIPVLILSAVGTAICLLLYNIIRYIPIAIILFEARGLFKSVIGHESPIPTLLIFSAILIAILLCRKVYNAFENAFLAVIFSTNGALLLLTILCIMTGYPENFLNFEIDVFNANTWHIDKFTVNVTLWLILTVFGLFSQLSIKTLFS